MRSHDLTPGRMIGVTLSHGEDFTALADTCRVNGIRHGYIAGFSTVGIVGTCQRLDNPHAPVWDRVHLTTIEALGGGTIAYADTHDRVAPHIHVSVGLKEHSATGHTSHLLAATVQFLTEMLIIEVAASVMRRIPEARLYDVPLLRIGDN
ncbi:DUF296 domain-containing protein [Verrucosispora sp. ts21]|uniref:PCC domain-containing protein n=1 Tax=Verrucosispora sp. ts21 TaxID=2069341 RepID=UPI000C881CF0|nr:DUF296 domain-containing protein [Verrucosispora sp. ts21]PMR62073.1 DUF296 domain-containing protein [Verrucosispora sp. ts21]